MANVEASNEDHVTSCIRPWTIRIEKTIDFRLLSEREWEAGFYTSTTFDRSCWR